MGSVERFALSADGMHEVGDRFQVDLETCEQLGKTDLGLLMRAPDGTLFLDTILMPGEAFETFIKTAYGRLERAREHQQRFSEVLAVCQQYTASAEPQEPLETFATPQVAMRRIHDLLQAALNRPFTDEDADEWVQQLQAAAVHSVQVAGNALLVARLQQRHPGAR